MDRLITRIDEMAKVGATDNGICRRSGSGVDQIARANCISYMMQAGMTVRKDKFNNIIGRLEGEGSPIVTGSHVDTVETAGKYDGVLGVLAGIEAAEQLRGEIKSPLEVVIFNDEEVTMDGSIGYCSEQPDIKAFLELHVEQGPVLDFQQKDIGVVSGIVGQRGCRFSVHGQENHAGTTPMNMRADALVKAAEIITYINRRAVEHDGLVATVGVLDVRPNSFSVVPGRVDFTMQVRDLDSYTMDKFVEEVSRMFDLRVEIIHRSEPALCDESIMDIISESCGDLEKVVMPSRASHDSQNFTWCPMGMIFVPSVGGISHSPMERTSDQHCLDGLNVLVETIRKIDVL